MTYFLAFLVLCYILYLLPKRRPKPEVTVALDDLTLYSERYRLKGRPDRIVKIGDYYIPEEWKSARTDLHCYHVQLGVYMLLIEEYYGVRPPYGLLILGKGKRITVKNTMELREKVMQAARQIRALRKSIAINKS